MYYKIKSIFNVPAKVFSPTTIKVNGVTKKSFEEINDIFCSFKSYGGTEKNVNDMIVVEDTAIVETFYMPDIKNNCKLVLPMDNNSEWEIIHVENVDMRNMYLKIKVRRLTGAA